MKDRLIRLASLIQEDAPPGWSMGSKPDRSEAVHLVEEIFVSSADLTRVETEALFQVIASDFSLSVAVLSGDLQRIPRVIRLALISRAFYSQGTVELPEEVEDDVSKLVEMCHSDWYETCGHRVFNLREQILANPSIDPSILVDEFEGTGDLANLQAILTNSNCPEWVRKRIIDRDHFVFQEGSVAESDLEALIEIAKGNSEY